MATPTPENIPGFEISLRNDTAPDMAKILAVARSYGLEFLGPMPD